MRRARRCYPLRSTEEGAGREDPEATPPLVKRLGIVDNWDMSDRLTETAERLRQLTSFEGLLRDKTAELHQLVRQVCQDLNARARVDALTVSDDDGPCTVAFQGHDVVQFALFRGPGKNPPSSRARILARCEARYLDRDGQQVGAFVLHDDSEHSASWRLARESLDALDASHIVATIGFVIDDYLTFYGR